MFYSRFVFPDGSAFVPTAESIEKKILDLSPQKKPSRGKTPAGNITASGGALWGDVDSEVERPYLPPRQIYRDNADIDRDHGGRRLPERYNDNENDTAEWKDAHKASQRTSEVESRSGKRHVAGRGNYSDSVIGGGVENFRYDEKTRFGKMPITGHGNFSEDLNAIMGSPSRNREDSESRRGKRQLQGKGNASDVLDLILSPPKGHGYPELLQNDRQSSRGGKRSAQGKTNSSNAVAGLMSPPRGREVDKPKVWRDASPSGEFCDPNSSTKSREDNNSNMECFDVDNALRKNRYF